MSVDAGQAEPYRRVDPMEARMRVAVCEFPDEPASMAGAWADLSGYLRDNPADLLVFPELPFCTWLFVGDRVDPAGWDGAVAAHDAMIARLAELGAAHVLASRPVTRDGRRLNEAFVWSAATGCRGLRAKWYLPDEEDGREALWFDRGSRDFRPADIGGLAVGVQLCSEMMYPEHAREIGLAGGQLIAQPRATGGHRRWQVAAAMAAITGGCYVATANRRSTARDWFAGGSFILSPEGDLLAETGPDRPVAVAKIDPDVAARAKSAYPRTLHRAYS